MMGIRALRWAGLILGVFISGIAVGKGVTVTDSTGHTVTVSHLPQRIVSLAPHATELLFEAGGGSRVVAVVSHSDFPEAARTLPDLGSPRALSLEAILSYKPDLVVAWPSGNPEAVIKQLDNLKIPVYFTQPQSVDMIAKDLRSLGALAGSHRGEQQAQRLLEEWKALADRYESKAPVPTFFEVWTNPLMTLNKEHMVSSVLRVCGAHNIFADAPVLVPRISREDVIYRAPALIVEGSHAERVGTDALYKEWEQFSMIPAVKNRDVYTINGDYLLRPTSRILHGARELCEKVDSARSHQHSHKNE